MSANDPGEAHEAVGVAARTGAWATFAPIEDDDGRRLAAATWVTSAVGWLLASLVAASFTQVIRRE